MILTYDQCLNQCMVQIKLYHTARRSNKWSYWTFQNIRDELAEILVSFAPHAAELRMKSEEAEYQRKVYYEKQKKHYLDNPPNGGKISISSAENLAMIDLKNHYMRETAARYEWQKARTLMERVDQVINGIATRLKPLDKYDSNSNPLPENTHANV